MSIPGIYKPIRQGKMVLVDGGSSDNLPVEDARERGADIVISVDVCSYYKKENDLKTAIDIVVSACNLLVSNLVKAQDDKGDIYIKIDQPNVSFAKFSAEDAIKSIKNGEEATKKVLPEILKLINKK
jgi:NTE family protein